MEGCVSGRNARGGRDMAVKERRKSVASTKGEERGRRREGEGGSRETWRMEGGRAVGKGRGGGIRRQREVVRACAHHFCRGEGTSLIRRRRGNRGEDPGWVEDPRRARK